MSLSDDIIDQDIEPTKNPENTKFAGFLVRVGASLIDAAVFLPLVAFSFYNFMSIKNFMLEVLFSILHMLYKPLMEFKYQATIGKMAMKLKVVDESFEAMTIEQSFLRNSLYIATSFASMWSAYVIYGLPDFATVVDFEGLVELQEKIGGDAISSATSFVLFISILFVLFDDKKQAMHDKMSRAYCIFK